MSTRIGPVWGLVACLALVSCGGGGSDSGGGDSGPPPTSTSPPPPPPPPPTVQYVAPSDSVFVAAIDPANPTTVFQPQGSYAGARLFTYGTIVAGSPVLTNQAGYSEMFKGGDGHLYRLDLAITGSPGARQVSSESNATVDDLCSLNGATPGLGTDVNYLAVQFFNDFANPEQSAYFYRLPGPDGVCNTSDDVIYMVKLGMSPTDAPIQARLPLAPVHDPNSGALTGFIVNEGTALTLYDSNFQNRVVLETPTTAIAVAYPLGLSQGTTSFTVTGRLFVLDGNIVYVNFGTQSVSPSLFTVPNWNPTQRFPTASSQSMQYFSVDTSDHTKTPVTLTSALYSMPRDGSAAPVQLATESGLIQAIASPVGATATVYSVVPPGAGGAYTIRAVTASSGQAPSVVTAVTTAGNSGSFIATASSIYYTSATVSSPDSTTRVFNNTQTGIVGMDGTVIEQPVASSKFIAQQSDTNGSGWLNVIRARNLTPVTLVSNANGITYTQDGISGATLEVVDTSTNSVSLTLGTLPAGTIVNGADTLVGTAGYIDGVNVNSTTNSSTRELLYVDTSTANSLAILTSNLK